MHDRSLGEDIVPDAFEKYKDCPDCEVSVHGPQRANSPGGCHVELCLQHRDMQSQTVREDDVIEYGERLGGAVAVMTGEADELAAHRPHADSHLYDIEEGLRGHAADLRGFLEDEYYK